MRQVTRDPRTQVVGDLAGDQDLLSSSCSFSGNKQKEKVLSWRWEGDLHVGGQPWVRRSHPPAARPHLLHYAPAASQPVLLLSQLAHAPSPPALLLSHLAPSPSLGSGPGFSSAVSTLRSPTPPGSPAEPSRSPPWPPARAVHWRRRDLWRERSAARPKRWEFSREGQGHLSS